MRGLSKVSRLFAESTKHMSTTAPPPVLFDLHGNIGSILMNRPEALNSYNHAMVVPVMEKLVAWESNDDVRAILLHGAGERAFCAGGDIVHLGDIYFENQVHHKIKTHKKPVVSLADRIVLGGGMGLALNSRFCVSTERSMFAMPETRIGYFPDCGVMLYFTKLPGSLGEYLSLTGHRVKGYDAKLLNFATHYVHSDDIGKLKEEILKCADVDEVKETLDSAAVEHDTKLSFSDNLDQINECFSAPTVLEIVARLKQSNTSFAKKTLGILSQMSPSALCITHKLYNNMKESGDFTECLTMEYDASAMTFALDFNEGVRALLVDKDNSPKWNPPTLEEVQDEVIENILKPIENRWVPLP